MQRLQTKLASVSASPLHAAVQDLTVDDRISRTQYQYTWKIQRANSTLDAAVAGQAQDAAAIADVPATSRTRAARLAGLGSRYGVTPRPDTSTIDNTLYDSFGQRQVSTMFTQVNQYHVILEVDPKFQQSPANLNDVYITPHVGNHFHHGTTSSSTSGATTGQLPPPRFHAGWLSRLERLHALEYDQRAADSLASRTVSRGHAFV